MHTFLIDSAVTSYLGFEKGGYETGKEESKLSDDFTEYVQKLTEKVLKSPSLKRVTVGSSHELFQYFSKDLADAAKDIAGHFYSAGSQADIMPDATLITAKGKLDGEKAIIIIRTDHKPAPFSSTAKDDVRIVRRQLLPSSPKADEAVVVCYDSQRVFIVEKKYTVDGKSEAILNSSWIHGDASMTDRQKENAVKKIIKKVQKETQDEMYIPKLKSVLSQNAVTESPVNVKEVIEDVIGQEADQYMAEEGVSEKDEMQNYSDSSKVTVTTDTGIKITVEADDILKGKDIKIDDGKIIISGFSEYKIS